MIWPRNSVLPILLVTLIIVLFVKSRLVSQSDADWEWANKHFGQVLDALLPLQRTAGYYVTYRSNRDYRTDVPEYWFLIGHDPNEKGYGLQNYLSAHVRVADTISIYDQLMRMHRQTDARIYAADIASLQQKIKLKKWDSNEMRCPSIKDQIEKFQTLQSKLPELTTEAIVIHPMNHTFHIQGGQGDMNIVLWDDESPLVKWALETRRALENCAAASR